MSRVASFALAFLILGRMAHAGNDPAPDAKGKSDITTPPTQTDEEKKKAGIETAIRLLSSDDPESRASAAEYFYNNPEELRSHPLAEMPLRRIANVQMEKEWTVRRKAVQALGELRKPDLYDQFMQIYTQDPEQSVKDWAIVGVGKTTNPKAFDQLKKWIESKDASKDDRVMAVVGMGFTQDRRGIEVLTGALGGDSLDVRENAIRALGNLGYPDGCAVILSRIMGEQSGQVMRAMIETLSRLKCKDACATFDKMLATIEFKVGEFRLLDQEISRAKEHIACPEKKQP